MSRDGTPLSLAGPIVTGSTFTYTQQFEPFGRSESGNYTCMATIRPTGPTATYLIEPAAQFSTSEITIGVLHPWSVLFSY